mgnify:FL=1
MTVGPLHYEGGSAAVVGYCPEDTASVTATASSAQVILSLVEYVGAHADPDLEGRFSFGWSTHVLNHTPGEIVEITAECRDAGDVVLATVGENGALFNSGASVSTPSTVSPGGELDVTVRCPTDSVRVIVSDENGEVVNAIYGVTPDTETVVTLAMPADLVPESELVVDAYCLDDGVFTVAFRSTTVQVAAASTALADTGPADIGVAVGSLSIVLLVLGMTAALRARRTTG